MCVVCTVEGAIIIHQIEKSKSCNCLYTVNCYLCLCWTENTIPTMVDINRYVARKHGYDWKEIGIELGLKLDDLNIIEKNHSLKSELCFKVMITSWIESTADNVTWKTLEVALTNVKRKKMGLDSVDDVGIDNMKG